MTAPAADAAHLYVSRMIGYHRGAIAMAEAELRDGMNPPTTPTRWADRRGRVPSSGFTGGAASAR